MRFEHEAQGPMTVAWHALDAGENAARLQQVEAAQGLEPAEAKERLARHGKDRLAERKPRSGWLAFLDQFKSLLIHLLAHPHGTAAAIRRGAR